jgi:uncharacterized integral membrane protein
MPCIIIRQIDYSILCFWCISTHSVKQNGGFMGKLKKIATLKRILTLIVIILVLIFAFQNLNSVSLNLVFFSLDIPLLVLIIALYILGVITGWAVK